METALRAALIGWLASDPVLGAGLSTLSEEAPARAALPWLAIAASASTDWSTKDGPGREVRIAFELHARGDRPDTAAALVAALEARLRALPHQHDGFVVVSSAFLRARTEQRPGRLRAILTEYRFRLLAA
ncbi:DUF3168 domain-containing protein [Novosphingobium piscinae]|uniref:DUF3168 domain-containing protein n=1 Tax=Novosphingobium piscinae TaxID=1507448 RepID=A0A7X1G1U1_9SPHN|nr:DUF3168 domain-containing protein [Novosphingobium piscinae]MBC2670914.1 DUF3168 domain-containing protein [Novosphingobium piscinae]